MSTVQRIKNVLISLLLFLISFVIVTAPRSAYDFVYYVISLMLLIYGLRLLWNYIVMARHMVDGKIILFQAIIVLDAALFMMTIARMADYIVLIYLLGIYAVSGAVDILRAFEAKRNRSSLWKKKIIIGVVESGIAVILVVIGIILRNTDVLVYGFAVTLISSGILKLYDTFRRTAIVYIQ